MFNLRSIAIFITRKLLTVSSFFGAIMFFFMANRASMVVLNNSELQIVVNSGIFILMYFVISAISLLLVKCVFRPVESLAVKEIKPVEGTALPTYIGLIVISLGIPGGFSVSAIVILLVLFILWSLLERVFYFNPVWLLFGYRFYEVKSGYANTVTVISKNKDIKDKVPFNNLREINPYTYFEEKQ